MKIINYQLFLFNPNWTRVHILKGANFNDWREKNPHYFRNCNSFITPTSKICTYTCKNSIFPDHVPFLSLRLFLLSLFFSFNLSLTNLKIRGYSSNSPILSLIRRKSIDSILARTVDVTAFPINVYFVEIVWTWHRNLHFWSSQGDPSTLFLPSSIGNRWRYKRTLFRSCKMKRDQAREAFPEPGVVSHLDPPTDGRGWCGHAGHADHLHGRAGLGAVPPAREDGSDVPGHPAGRPGVR